jgi:hypothetical protein
LEEKETAITWCNLKAGEVIDHNTIFFPEQDSAKEFVEMFS